MDQFKEARHDPEHLKRLPTEQAERLRRANVFKNSTYTVLVTLEDVNFQCGPTRKGNILFHLSIKRNDREPIKDWRELQQIKNLLCGTEKEAVELYPAESRLVDTSNQYHLWVVMDNDFRFPFGYQDRLVIDHDDPLFERAGYETAKQRPLTNTDTHGRVARTAETLVGRSE